MAPLNEMPTACESTETESREVAAESEERQQEGRPSKYTIGQIQTQV